MKYLLTSLIFFLLPLSGFAASVSDCEPNSLVCLCPPTYGVNDVPQEDVNPLDAEASCDIICTQLQDAGADVEDWQIQCRINNIVTALDQGSIGSTQTLTERVADAESDLLDQDFDRPNLGIDIPGLSFSDSEQRINYSTGTETRIIASNYIGEYIEAIYGWLIAAGALVAIVLFMVGGLEWMLSGGNANGVQRAKERISRAAIGLVLLLSAYTLAYLIDPDTVTFETLDIPIIERIDFIENETPFNFPFVESDAFDSTDVTDGAASGVGWNDFIIFDQTQFGSTPYGPTRCMVPASSSSWGTGNIKSSGCGVAAFTGVLHTYGSQVTIAEVADTFYEEGYRPKDENGCGHSGTHSNGFIYSSLVEEAGLVGERIEIGDRISAESKERILQEITDGNPVISSYRTDSGGGHYIVLVGLDEEDNLLINNPWGGSKQKRTQEDYFSRIKSAVVVKPQ